jgi:acetyl-CoA synthetase
LSKRAGLSLSHNNYLQDGDTMSEIESLMHEERVFAPPADFLKNATVAGMAAYQALCAEAEKDYEGFWA